MKTNLRALMLGAGVAALVLGSASANAAVYSFYRLTDNNNNQPGLGDQLKVEVVEKTATTATETGTVSFKFYHEGSIEAVISEIYFDDGGFLVPGDPVLNSNNPVPNVLSEPVTLDQSAGVSMTAGSANPSNLPSGENAPNFVTTAGFLADTDSGPGGNSNGVNSNQDPDEWVELTFNYANDTLDIQDIYDALTGLDLRIGLHVTSIGGGGSDSYLNNTSQDSVPPEVPLPGALLLLLSGLGPLGYVSWRQRKRSIA